MKRFGYISGKNAKNNVASFLELHGEKRPSQVAFYWVEPEKLLKWSSSPTETLEHQTMTMGRLAELSARVATGLTKLGIKQGDRLILFVPMSAQLYLAMSALQRIGAIPVFLDSWTRRTNLLSSIQQVKPVGIISYDRAFQFGKNIAGLDLIPIKISIDPTDVNPSALLDDLAKTRSKAPITPVEQEDTALITFTTGSSGTPKGANRTHRFLAAQHYALNRYVPYLQEDVDLPVFPVFTLNNIAAGVSTVIPAIDVGEPKESDPFVLLSQMKSCRVNCTTLSPSLFNAVAQYCLKTNLKVPSLRRIITGGAPVSRDDLERFKSVSSAEVLILYGSTEVEPMAHISDVEISSVTDVRGEGVQVGRIDDGLRYKLLKIQKGRIEVNHAKDWAKLESTPGEAGELIVAGEHVCGDYYNNPEAFKRAKIKDLDGTVWHRTGDVVRIDEKACLWVLGRVHNAILRKGKYLFPVQAEIILKRLPFVLAAAYLGVPDGILGERTVAVIVQRRQELGTQRPAWEAQVKKAFQSSQIPLDKIVFCDNIPMDPRHHSKIEYDLLRKQLIEAGQI